MNYRTLLDDVSAFMTRTETAFGSRLLRAVNNAKMYLQRKADFGYLLSTVQFDLDANGQTGLTQGKLYPVSVPAVTRKVKKIVRPYLLAVGSTQLTNLTLIKHSVQDVYRHIRQGAVESVGGDLTLVQAGSVGYLYPPQTFSSTSAVVADCILREREYEEVISSISGNNSSVVANRLVASAADFTGVEVDDFVYNAAGTQARVTAVNSTTNLTLSADIFTTSPQAFRVDLLHKTDRLLEIAYDFLLYRSMFELNFFLKEDQRVQITAALLKDTLESVLTDEDSASDGEDLTLD